MHKFEYRISQTSARPIATVRVWTQRSPIGGLKEFQRQHGKLERLILRNLWLQLTVRGRTKGLETLAGIKFVNAIEMVDSLGDGLLVYVDWP
jgi:hypothetical protein